MIINKAWVERHLLDYSVLLPFQFYFFRNLTPFFQNFTQTRQFLGPAGVFLRRLEKAWKAAVKPMQMPDADAITSQRPVQLICSLKWGLSAETQPPARPETHSLCWCELLQWVSIYISQTWLGQICYLHSHAEITIHTGSSWHFCDTLMKSVMSTYWCQCKT